MESKIEHQNARNGTCSLCLVLRSTLRKRPDMAEISQVIPDLGIYCDWNARSRVAVEHDRSTCQHCRYQNPGNASMIHTTIPISSSSMLRHLKEFEQIPEPEVFLYHGTFLSNLVSILDTGLQPSMCQDSSMGHGVYLTPCLHMSYGFSDAVVLQCRVKLGRHVSRATFEEFDPNCTGQTADSHSLTSGLEIVVFRPERIIPIRLCIKPGGKIKLDNPVESRLT